MPIISQPILLEVLTQLSVIADYDVEKFSAPDVSWGPRLVGPGWSAIEEFCSKFPSLAVVARGMVRVIAESFARSGAKTGWISASEIEETINTNQRVASHVASAHEKLALRFLENTGFARQMVLVGYVSHVVLAEDPTSAVMSYNPQDSVISGAQFQHDRCHLFLLAKAVVDLLDRGPA
jgi:hypothetical protein